MVERFNVLQGFCLGKVDLGLIAISGALTVAATLVGGGDFNVS